MSKLRILYLDIKDCQLEDNKVKFAQNNPMYLQEYERRIGDTCRYEQCSNNCRLCESEPGKCTACYFNTPFLISDTHNCDTNCPKEGYYTDVLLQKCTKCKITNCSNCQWDQKSCEDCQDGYLQLTDTLECKQFCPSSYHTDLHNRKCIPCKTKHCTKCIIDRYFCDQCSGPNGEIYLQDNTCVQQCPFYKYYTNMQSYKCEKCADEKCLGCYMSIDQCVQCEEPYKQHNHKCVKDCPPGYFDKQGACQECDQNECKTCQNDSKQCTSCNDRYLLIEDKYKCRYLQVCPHKYDLIKGTTICRRCSEFCERCEGSAQVCIECEKGYKFDENIKNIKVCILDQNGGKENQSLILWLTTGAFLLIVIIVTFIIICIKMRNQKAQNLKSISDLENDLNKNLINSGDFDENIMLSEDQQQRKYILRNDFKKRYEKLHRLGCGTYGIVDKYFDKKDQKNVAIKQIKSIDTQEQFKIAFQEVDNLLLINKYCDQNVVKLLDYYIVLQSKKQTSNRDSGQDGSNTNKNNSQQVQQKNINTNYDFSIQQKDSLLSETDSFSNQKINSYITNTSMEQNDSVITNSNILSVSNDISNSTNILGISQDIPKPNSLQQNQQQSQIQLDKYDKSLILIFELAQNSLMDEIQKRSQQNVQFSQQEVVKLIKNMSACFCILHDKLQMAHRDIKPHNILNIDNQWKLADLGVSKIIDHYQTLTNNYSLKGTLNYVSPEEKFNYIMQLQGQKISKPFNPYKADIFQFGLTLYQVVTLKCVQNLNLSQEILEESIEHHLQNIDYINSNILGHIKLMLQWDPDKRITFQQLYSIYNNI